MCTKIKENLLRNCPAFSPTPMGTTEFLLFWYKRFNVFASESYVVQPIRLSLGPSTSTKARDAADRENKTVPDSLVLKSSENVPATQLDADAKVSNIS